MTRYNGKIGFAIQSQTKPGVWKDTITERSYVGNVIRYIVNRNQGSQINDSLTLSQSISLIMDPFLNDHISSIRYLTWLGMKWNISSMDVQYPRIIFQLGSEYNGPTS